MTFFAGHTGTVRLRRSTQATAFESTIEPDDINTILNRFGFDGSMENVLTGDRLVIRTDDPRKLAFLSPSTWPQVNERQAGIALYANVNIAGGVRLFRDFEDAVNNNRANELPLIAFTGAPLPVTIEIQDTDFNTLGGVTGFTLQTEREAVETTALSDKFKQQYSAGLISGSGSIDCLFAYQGATSSRQELPVLMLQIIQRIEIGSSFEAQLFLTDQNVYGSTLDVYYQFEGVVTRAGVEVKSDAIISASIDFLTTGEIKLFIGSAPGYVLQENDDRILLQELGIDALLKEVDD